MATTRFNNNILAAARRMKDVRATANASDDTGKRYTTAIWTEYQNRAIKDLILETYLAGPKQFPDVMPEIVKTSANITITAGVGDFPSDAWLFIDLAKNDYSVYIHKIFGDVTAVLAARHGTIVPSATEPYFYEELRKLYVLPSAAYTVKGRYILTPAEIVVVTSSGNGNYSTADGNYTASTKTLVVTMNSAFVTADTGKHIIIMDNGTFKVHFAHIASVTNGTTVVLEGDGAPTTDMSADAHVLVADTNPTTDDIRVSSIWDSNIVDRMVAYALQDAKAVNA
jgi:hypothetical protein